MIYRIENTWPLCNASFVFKHQMTLCLMHIYILDLRILLPRAPCTQQQQTINKAAVGSVNEVLAGNFFAFLKQREINCSISRISRQVIGWICHSDIFLNWHDFTFHQFVTGGSYDLVPIREFMGCKLLLMCNELLLKLTSF